MKPLAFPLFLAGLPFALLALSCGTNGGHATPVPSPPLTTGSSAPGGLGFPPGIESDGPTYRPAASDKFGAWQVLEINGRSVEIPFGEQWNIQGVQDPCFGDERYYILLEDRSTGDRIRVDMVDAKVTTVSANPVRLEPITERILRTVKGAHQIPAIVQTFGPHPTLTTCSGETPGTVPTLTLDTFTPPVGTPKPPAVTTPPTPGEETAP